MLFLIQKKDESLYDAGLRRAKEYSLEWEYNVFYQHGLSMGLNEEAAVWYALHEWDLFEYKDDIK